ncbi:unnamed protein product [Caenorhabditis angaria]|uniref:Serpentine receptor class gamma n=1 Tax=Caenorhabditis angaria TaxID=860376 RepID=A0A9P1I7R6_9PELO|nr:unnamed protein product [Caenorhabditis angaria]
MVAFNDTLFASFRIIKNSQPISKYCESGCSFSNPNVIHYSQTSYLLPLFVIVFDLFVQILNVLFIISRKYLKNGSFFAMLFIMSLVIIIRSLIVILSYISTAFDLGFSVSYAMYADFFSNFFSLPIIFLMSLNRYLCFVSNYFNEMLFERNRFVIPVLVSISISGLATFGSITSSQIKRAFYNYVGFVDYNTVPGFKTSIARVFYIFPLGSTICYILLFLHLKQQSKLVMMSTRNVEQKVFAQLLVTAILYGLMSIFIEAILFLDGVLDNYQVVSLISILNIINYLPGISLPLMLMLSTFKFGKKPKQIAIKDIANSTTASILNK